MDYREITIGHKSLKHCDSGITNVALDNRPLPGSPSVDEMTVIRPQFMGIENNSIIFRLFKKIKNIFLM